MNDISSLLNEEIVRRLKELPDMEAGTKEIGAAIEDIEHLFKMRVEERKLDSEDQAKACEQHDKQLENVVRAKDRWLRFGLDAAGLIMPMIFYGIWMRRGFRFEETGTFTSKTFLNLINRFKPTK